MASDCWRTCEPRRRRKRLSITSCCAPPQTGHIFRLVGQRGPKSSSQFMCPREFWAFLLMLDQTHPICITSVWLLILCLLRACWMPGRSNWVAPIRVLTAQAEPVKDLLPLLSLNSLQVFSICPDICLLFPPLSFSVGTPLLSLLW